MAQQRIQELRRQVVELRKEGRSLRAIADELNGRRTPTSRGREWHASSVRNILARGFVLQGFDRTTEELKVELHLEPVPIERLRSLFDVGDDPEMCDTYPVDAVKAGVLAPLVTEPIDLERYDFFLQRYA